jgi:hypothetical protein
MSVRTPSLNLLYGMIVIAVEVACDANQARRRSIDRRRVFLSQLFQYHTHSFGYPLSGR